LIFCCEVPTPHSIVISILNDFQCMHMVILMSKEFSRSKFRKNDDQLATQVESDWVNFHP
jgi:hypothetical protein